MRQYIVNTFTDLVFGGSPVAVCIVDSWIPSRDMHNIAIQNSLPETVFILNRGIYYELRCFSPYGEVYKYVNSTQAAAYVLFRFIKSDIYEITFKTAKLDVVARKKYDNIYVEIPQLKLLELETSYEVKDALGVMPKKIFGGPGGFFVLESEEQVREFNPDVEKIIEMYKKSYGLPRRDSWTNRIDEILSDDIDDTERKEEKIPLFSELSFCITAASDNADCVCRYISIDENIYHGYEYPIKYETMMPYWFSRKKHNKIVSWQIDERDAILECINKKDTKIEVGGKAKLYAISDIYVE